MHRFDDSLAETGVVIVCKRGLRRTHPQGEVERYLRFRPLWKQVTSEGGEFAREKLRL